MYFLSVSSISPYQLSSSVSSLIMTWKRIRSGWPPAKPNCRQGEPGVSFCAYTGPGEVSKR